MMISPTFCASAALLLSCLLATQAAIAHRVHEHADETPVSAHGLTPDELIQRYTRTGDDGLLQLAHRQLGEAGQTSSPHTLLQLAWLAQAEHRFARARELLARVVSKQPGNGQAWLLEASVAQVAGDPGAARRACAQVALSVSTDAAMTCFARLALTPAEKEAAYRRLQMADERSGDQRLAAWRWSVRAELARDLGRLQAAEQDFRRSIAAVPAVQTRASLMDLLLQQARYADALALSDDNTPVPALAVRRLLAQKALGADIHHEAQSMDALFKRWLAAGDFRHAREMAMFFLDVVPNADLAFRAASINATLQREPEDLALLRRARKMS
ncbi:MAG: hypothetical protein R3E54_12355 [Halioglobus sp.]